MKFLKLMFIPYVIYALLEVGYYISSVSDSHIYFQGLLLHILIFLIAVAYFGFFSARRIGYRWLWSVVFGVMLLEYPYLGYIYIQSWIASGYTVNAELATLYFVYLCILLPAIISLYIYTFKLTSLWVSPVDRYLSEKLNRIYQLRAPVCILVVIAVAAIALSWNEPKNINQYTFTFDKDVVLGHGFISDEAVFVDAFSTSKSDKHSFFILSASNNTAGTVLQSANTEPAEDIFRNSQVEAVIDHDRVILSGETVSGGKAVAVYSISSKEILWLTPPNKIYKFIGWSKDRESILVNHRPSIWSEYGPITTSGKAVLAEMVYGETPSRVLMDIDNTKPNFESKPFESEPFTYASISTNGERVVTTGSAISGKRSAHLITNINENNEKRIYISTNYLGRSFWLKDNAHFIMSCDISKVCLYSSDGNIERVYENNHGEFVLIDYDKNTDKMLLRRMLDKGHDNSLFAISKFHDNSTAVTIYQKLLEQFDILFNG